MGKQGEQNAINYLKKIKSEEYKVDSEPKRFLIERKDGFTIMENGLNLFDATWENALKEQYKGYDISYVIENKKKYYIEVKSTVSSTKK